MDRRIDGRTGDGRIDGFLYVRLFDRIGRIEDRIEGQTDKLLYPRSHSLTYTC